MRTPIYWHRLIYRNTYGRSHPAFEERFQAVADLIKPGSSVLDLGCGDARLYTHYLKDKDCSYQGIDLSLSMVPHHVLPYTIKGNAIMMELPPVDYVVMMEALYHFNSEAGVILGLMRAAAREKVIILEQIKNKITFLPSWLTRFLSNPGNGSGSSRFDKKELQDIIREVDPNFEEQEMFDGYDLLITIAGGSG